MKNRILSCLFTLAASSIFSTLSALGHAATLNWSSGFPSVMGNVILENGVLTMAGTSSCTSVTFIASMAANQFAWVSAYVYANPGTTNITFSKAFTGAGSGTYGVTIWAQGVDVNNNPWGAVTGYPYSVTVP